MAGGPVTFTILAALAGAVAVIPVLYFEYRRTLRRRQEEGLRWAGPPQGRAEIEAAVDDQQVRKLMTYPPESVGLSSLAALERLSPCAIGNLAALGYDEITKRSVGLPPGLPLASEEGPSFTRDELGANGYVATAASPIPDDSRSWVVLTDEGRHLARLLTAATASPEWLWEASRKRG